MACWVVCHLLSVILGYWGNALSLGMMIKKLIYVPFGSSAMGQVETIRVRYVARACSMGSSSRNACTSVECARNLLVPPSTFKYIAYYLLYSRGLKLDMSRPD